MNLIATIVKAPDIAWPVKTLLLLGILASLTIVAGVLVGLGFGFVWAVGLS